MNFKEIGLITIIASVFGAAHASSIVTSKAYVDMELEKKQDAIPGYDSSNDEVQSILTDTENDGEVGKIMILTQEILDADEAALSDETDNEDAIPTAAAVANALGDKQDAISTAEVNFYTTSSSLTLPSIVSFDSTNGLTGDEIGILDYSTMQNSVGFGNLASYGGYNSDKMVPTVKAVANSLIPLNLNSTAVNNYSTSFNTAADTWPSNGEYRLVNGETFAGGLALKQNRQIGAAPVDSNSVSTDVGKVLVVDNDGKIAMGSAPDSAPTNSSSNLVTSGGVYSALQSAVSSIHGLPSGSANQVLQYNGTTSAWESTTMDTTPTQSSVKPVTSGGVYDAVNAKQDKLGGSGNGGKVVTATDTAGTVTYTATYDGSGTYNAQNDADKIATAAAVNTRQAKKTCVGWPDGTTTADSTHTDSNCWLWNLPD